MALSEIFNNLPNTSNEQETAEWYYKAKEELIALGKNEEAKEVDRALFFLRYELKRKEYVARIAAKIKYISNTDE